MKGGSLLKHTLETGIEQVWQVESIELGAEREIGVVRMRCLTQRNTIDGRPVEVAAPSNMVSEMVARGILEVYERAEVL